MGNRAPDNQPTESIRHMLEYAERQVRDWTFSAQNHRAGLERAEEQRAHWVKTLESLEAQLKTRLQEERNED